MDIFKYGITYSADEGTCSYVLNPEHIEELYQVEELYQAFKTRLMNECSIIERMTHEEYEEWKNQMVVKK